MDNPHKAGHDCFFDRFGEPQVILALCSEFFIRKYAEFATDFCIFLFKTPEIMLK